MKNILAIILLSAVVFISCNNNSSNTNNSKQPLIVASDTETEKYQCPMKCQGDTAYTAAGQCPVCEMDLQKVTQSEMK
jgi:Cu2+-exporting ATPase